MSRERVILGRELVEQLPLAVYQAGLTEGLPPVYISPQIEDLTGYTAAEWVAERPFWRIVDERDREQQREVARRTIAELDPIRSTYRMCRRDGETIWVREESVVILDEEGNPKCVQGFFLDITELKQAEEALRETQDRIASSEALYRAVVEGSPDLIALVDADGVLSYVSAAHERVMGYPAETFLGRAVSEFEHPDDTARNAAAREQVLAGANIEQSFRVRHREGHLIELETLARRIPGPGGRDQIISISRDVTARRATEKALADAEALLRHAQKMEAVGRLAGGIAHDFNNLLTAIAGYADLLGDELDDDSPLREDVAEIRLTAKRGAQLTRQLLAFSRQQVLDRRILHLNEIVEDTTKLLARLVGEDVTLTLRLDRAADAVRADRSGLEQVLTNLVVNARDAMPAGGEITIETRAVREPDGNDRVLELMVSDTGSGIDPDTAGRVFEPYFTTKEHGKGTGLGLATVYGIVTQFGGTIDFATELGSGTTFTIRLPAVDQVAAIDPDATPHARHTLGAGQRILLAEDDDRIRALLERQLGGLGYTVEVARDGIEALALLDQADSPPALLVTDIVMPNLGGRELIEAARRLHPGIGALLLSGYANDELADGLPERCLFLAKPFSLDLLATTVGEAIELATGGSAEPA